jgi:hypothetical protein
MINTKRFISSLVCISFIIVVSAAFLGSCKNYHRNNSYPDVSLSNIREGESLAAKYCQACHALPDPSMLDTKSWEKGVLPNMGPRLGIFQFGFDTYPSYKNDSNLDPDFYPSKPLLTLQEWRRILDYYVATSPDSMPNQNREQTIKNNTSLFRVRLPSFSYSNPTTSFVKINGGDTSQAILISDVIKQKIYRFSSSLQLNDSITTSGPILDLDLSGQEWLACNAGILNPNNSRAGKVRL